MKYTDMDAEQKKIQKMLNRLISEEIIARDFYNGCINACNKSDFFKDDFEKVAEDEFEDHAKNMIDWAKENGYSVPFKYGDYEKYADEECVKQLKNLKKDEEIGYYLSEAVKSEVNAIKSYEEFVWNNDIPMDLKGILLRNYYDELEHLDIFQLKIAGYGAGYSSVES